MSSNATANDPYVNFTSDQARQHLLMDIARTFKGTDPDVDKRIDANAELIAGRPGIKSIPGRIANEPRVPFYMEGEPGVGKTSLVGAAIREFCALVGLNYIDDKKMEEGYRPGEKDFVFTSVNLSGKNNTADVGGLPTKSELYPAEQRSSRSNDAGEWLLTEVASKLKAVGKFAKLGVTEGAGYEKGSLRAVDITVTGDLEAVRSVVTAVVNQVGEEVKTKGAGLALLKDGEEPQDGRMYIQPKQGTKGTRVTVFAPKAMANELEFVSDMLPNRRMAVLGKARFALINFDDVANASESVRNVLLEVAQSNRYSGVMDIGKSMVTFSGNMGAEDNTNTQSEQSDAEVTRLFKVRIRDTPKDWARRIAIKYSEVGDCMMGSFIGRHGNEPGVFRDSIGDARTGRGIPKPNSRSLENALAKVLPYYQMAKEAGISPTVFSDEIEVMVKGTAGANVATRYIAYARAMLTEAIPLADKLLATGKLDVEKFEKSFGTGAKSSEQDFAFRFATALADSFVERVAFSDEARKVSSAPTDAAEHLADSTERMCLGLSRLEPGQVTFCLSRVMARMGGIARMGSHDGVEVKLTQPTYNGMAEGMARSIKRGLWADPEKAGKDFASVVAGSKLNGTPKPKARP